MSGRPPTHVTSLAALAGAAGLLAWAAGGTTFRQATGDLATTALWPVAGALALGAIAFARGPWRTTGQWLIVAAFGQAAALQAIDAGHLLRYQHYLPIDVLASRNPWALGVIVAQTVIVAAGLARWWRTSGAHVRWPAAPRYLLAFGLAACTAATVSPSVLRYATELVWAAFVQLLNIATIALAAAHVPAKALAASAAWLDRWLGPPGDEAPSGIRRDRFGLGFGVLAFGLSSALAVVAYDRHPHVPDEVAYLMHARYFAEGRFTMEAPPVVEAFDVDLLTYEPNRWYSPVPLGWPAVLAVGAFVGAPWLVNPLLAGIAVWLCYLFLGELYPRRVARWAAMLLATSPWFLFLGMSMMTHMLTLTLALAAGLGIARSRRLASVGWAALAGIGVGGVSLVRPLDGLLVGMLMAAWAIGIGGSRLTFGALTALLATTVVTGAIAFPYNAALTGDPFTFPINAYTDSHYGKNSNAYGFGADRGLGWAIDPNPGHGPVDGVINANLNLFGINTDLFGWSTGSLVFVAVLVAFWRLARADWLMIATIVTISTGYFFYYFSGGPDFAARYWFPVVVPFVALSARGLSTTWTGTARTRASLATLALIGLALTLYVPWRAIDKYRHFRGMRAGIHQLASTHGFANDLVLVRGERHPDYASAMIENPIDLMSGPTVYAWDRSAEVRERVLRAFPERRVWLVDGPSITGAGFRVAGGPFDRTALPPFPAAAR